MAKYNQMTHLPFKGLSSRYSTADITELHHYSSWFSAKTFALLSTIFQIKLKAEILSDSIAKNQRLPCSLEQRWFSDHPNKNQSNCIVKAA